MKLTQKTPIKTIAESLSIGRETAKKVKAILFRSLRNDETGERLALLEYLASNKLTKTISWVNDCLNFPKWHEIKLEAINELLNLYGIEGIAIPGKYFGGYNREFCADYVNNGDTYAITVIWDYVKGEWRLDSWGDVYEQYENYRG